MKTPGHYFCDRCDDVAFGETCQLCSTQTRFIPTGTPAPETPVIIEQDNGSELALTRSQSRFHPVPEQIAADYFQRMRAAVAAVEPK
jgi:hypothetical protein